MTKVDDKSDAYKAGLREGDLVSGFIPDKSNANPNYLASQRLPWKSGKLSWFKNYDDEKSQEAQLTIPPLAGNEGKGIFKQSYAVNEFFKAGGSTGGVFDALGQAWSDTGHYTVCMFATLRNLVSGNVKAKNLSGPVGIGNSIFAFASKRHFVEYMWWLGFISLNLGVMQLLPIPLLDGFHLVMIFIEKLKGSAVSAKIQEKFMYAGIALIGSLFAYVMWNDISRFFTKS